MLSEKGAVGGLQLPDHITAEEFANKYLDMDIDNEIKINENVN